MTADCREVWNLQLPVRLTAFLCSWLSNRAYSSTTVVPVFYSGYTLLGALSHATALFVIHLSFYSPQISAGFANSMVFLDQVGPCSFPEAPAI